eukprot:1290691-Ditylum_brightwellii.AAC.2
MAEYQTALDSKKTHSSAKKHKCTISQKHATAQKPLPTSSKPEKAIKDLKMDLGVDSDSDTPSKSDADSTTKSDSLSISNNDNLHSHMEE